MPSLNIKDYLLAGSGILLMVVLAWAWRVDSLRAHYKSERDLIRAEYAVFRTTIKDMTAHALAAQKEKAREADMSHQRELADARRAGDTYKRANRVRREAPIHSGPATPGTGAGVPESPAADAIVVTEADFDICTANSQYAMNAHKWAISLGDEQ